jgi:tripartite-type tricarboxylate transporter receptor subunit TctC
VVDRLAKALDNALDDEAVRKRIIDLGGAVPEKAERTPAQFAKYVQAEIERWAPILKSAKEASEKTKK